MQIPQKLIISDGGGEFASYDLPGVPGPSRDLPDPEMGPEAGITAFIPQSLHMRP
jgi:hypothetical protein